MLLAHHDVLAGLADRVRFHEKLNEAVARSCRYSQVMAVLYLDIDHVKAINEELTREGDDQVRLECACRLKACVRKIDTIAQLDNDVFVMILEGMHAADDAAIVARKIIKAMEPIFEIPEGARRVTVSIGVAICPPTQSDTSALLHKADEALYMAKAAGRNTYQLVH